MSGGIVDEGRSILKAIHQEWLLDDTDDASAEKLLTQISTLNKQYPGGLAAYVKNAKNLLEDSKNQVNPFDGYRVEIPEGLSLVFGSEEFAKYEKVGLKEVANTGFVLVAGGLGERLGYHGIKLELPVEITTSTSYLEYYIQNLEALKVESGAKEDLPLAIMTSGDTHDKTVELLEKNNYFGRDPKTITLMKQEKVPSINDNEGRFVKDSPSEIQTKPHGHGDVHQLLLSTGTAQAWADRGINWIVFLQDTNAMTFNALAAIGLSKERELEVNSITIPRGAKEAIGGLARLVSDDIKKPSFTISVEYNQLEPLLNAVGSSDVADPKTGLSPYPGNINTLIFAIKPYLSQLKKTGGLTPEFVNPKYADETRTSFKKPTRLECMMQDYAKGLDSSAKVGFTTLDRLMVFSPVKNAAADAASKAANGLEPMCAASGEADFYESQVRKLLLVAPEAEIPQASEAVEYHKVPIKWYPRIVLHPSFAPTLESLKRKISGDIKISPSSTLIIEGENVTIDGLELDGALVIKAIPGAKVSLKNIKVQNKGWKFNPVGDDAPEYLQIRGYKIEKIETKELIFTRPGVFGPEIKASL